jgi:phosphohistidine phosphatase
VACAPGTYKYVQVQLTHPREAGALLAVRSFSTCEYHAETYRELMRELGRDAATAGVVGRVIGGGRIRFGDGNGDGGGGDRAASAEVYGYSKTFGRTPGCNEKTAEILRANCPGLTHVDWSDNGY